MTAAVAPPAADLERFPLLAGLSAQDMQRYAAQHTARVLARLRHESGVRPPPPRDAEAPPGDELRRRRAAFGLSQTQLGHRINCARTTVQSAEHGRHDGRPNVAARQAVHAGLARLERRAR